MTKQKPLTESAISTDAVYNTLQNARKNFKSKKALYVAAEQHLAECELDFQTHKNLHDQKLRELR